MRFSPAPYDDLSPPSSARVNTFVILILAGLFVALSISLLVNIPSRLEALARVESEVQRLSRVVQCEEAMLAGLQAAAQYARSDAYVERWARQHHRTKPGEVLVVLPEASSPQQVWWAPFVGKPCNE
ncbi:MAG: hypothetical protein RMJ86_09085 [Anaerolineae bacterium]|nr:hypothetical protein [Anaerolineae bacterium]